MPPRILLGGTDVPSLGGSSTALYDLFRRMQQDGYDVHLVNLLEEQDAAFFQYTFGDDPGNPDHLPQVTTCWLSDDLNGPQLPLAEYIAAIDADVMVGFGYLAGLMLKRAAPSRGTVLVTSSCQQSQEYVTSGRTIDAVSLLSLLGGAKKPPRLIHQGENAAVEACDLLVTHSPLVLTLMERFFPRSIGKVYPEPISFAEWICAGAEEWQHKARPFEQRDIDVLFVASDWGRHVKNYPLVEKLGSSLRGAAIHVVGDAPRVIPGVTHHGFLESRERLFDLYGRARCVACPSLIDAAPGILFEASVLGCNVVASRNCGNWELCHPDLLVDPFVTSGFAACIERARTRPYSNGRKLFLSRNGYENLLGILTAFAQPFAGSAIS